MEKNIVWFDLETTGVNTATDRIIEIYLHKTDLMGTHLESYHTYVNPDGVKSRPEAFNKHGITEEELKDKPKFREIAQEVVDFIGDCDLGGYNVLWFDIPLLVEELIRCGIIFNHRGRSIIDPFLIQAKYESRNLESTYKRLTGKTLENVHSAQADVKATVEIFQKQKDRYPEMPESFKDIDKEVCISRSTMVDLSGKFIIGEVNGKNEILFNFGKWKGEHFKNVYEKDKGYIEWMINKGEFNRETKIIAKKLLTKMEKDHTFNL